MEKIIFKNNGQPAVNDENLNQMQTNVENAINELEANTTEALTNLGNYSTEEVDTGEKWIDGKPIYRKVLVFTTTSTGSEKTVKEIDISDLKIEALIEWYGVLKSNSNNIYNAERCEGENNFTRVESTASYKKLTYHTKGTNSYFAGTVTLTIRYTKTAD